MKKFQYQLIKYVHDHFTSEFVNVGVVVYAPEYQYLSCKVINRHVRIKAMFPHANGRFIEKVLKSIESSIKQRAKELGGFFHVSEQLETITSNIFPKDDSSIQFTPVKVALDIELDAALTGLYKELVDKYMPTANRNKSLTDNDVWKEKYREYFEQLNIANRLVKHTLQTSNDTFEFDKSWKNEVWHCYQPVSFALQDKESVKDKVYRWAGRLQELRTANEELHLTFLTATSKEHKDLEPFIREYLLFDEKGLKTDIVKEKDAEKFATSVKKLMVEHDNE
jgi:hypothetical protein